MYCNQCGRRLDEGSQFCAGCGKPVESTGAAVQPANVTTYFGSEQQSNQGSTIGTYFDNAPVANKSEGNVFWWGVLSLFVPIVGIILYIQWKQIYPKRAKVCLWCGIVSIAFNVYLTVSGVELAFQLTKFLLR